MIVERAVDCGHLYEAERRALLELTGSLPESRLQTTVPATPAWSVRDVVAHLVGIAADLNAGHFGTDDDPNGWTARQVGSRAGRSLDELAAEWEREAPTFEEGLRLLGYGIGSHFVGDLVQHVADVHHALGLPRRGDDDEAVAVSLDFYLDSFHESLLDAGVGSVAVERADERLVLGAGPLVATVTAGAFELLRALGGRRTEAQILAFAWSGDAAGIAPLVSRYGLPATGIVEP